jgi:hypothetical protein
MTTRTHGGPRSNSGGRRKGAGRKAHKMLRGLTAGTVGRTKRGALVFTVVDTPDGLVMYDAHGWKITIEHEVTT